MGLKQRCSWVVATILICAVRLVSAQSPAANIRVLNLRDYGWQVPDPLQPREGDAVERRSIAVDHNGRVFVAFTVREHSGLVTREQPALSLHIIRFSPAGKADPLFSLPTNGWRSNSIYLSDSDEIIVRANDTIQFWQVDPGNAVCGKSARTDPRGGYGAIRIPTATPLHPVRSTAKNPQPRHRTPGTRKSPHNRAGIATVPVHESVAESTPESAANPTWITARIGG